MLGYEISSEKIFQKLGARRPRRRLARSLARMKFFGSSFKVYSRSTAAGRCDIIPAGTK